MIPKKTIPKNYYFSEITEDAICQYNSSEDPLFRNDIYTKLIHPAFDKLAEIMIYKYKFYCFDVPLPQVQHEVVSHLVVNIGKYKSEKGKAFSYFSIVAKNWLILNNNKNYKNNKIHDTLETLDYGTPLLNARHSEEVIGMYSEYIEQMLQYWDININEVFPKRRDLTIADSVLEIFRIKDNIENFNKKALYILIRERSNAKTQHITKIINVMKVHNTKLLEEFHANGVINLSKFFTF